jgi:hypothetical protein
LLLRAIQAVKTTFQDLNTPFLEQKGQSILSLRVVPPGYGGERFMMDTLSIYIDMFRGLQQGLDDRASLDRIYLCARKSLALPISGRSVSAFFESATSFW